MVTGSAGFIGRNLCFYLMKHGHTVVGVDAETDIVTARLDDVFAGAEVVFHLAAISSLPECQADPARAFQVNVVGTARVLEACRATKVRRVIFASTSAVYENSFLPDSGYEESATTMPDLVYAQTKLAAERLCDGHVRNFGMDIVTLRLFNVYGPGQNLTRKSPPFTAYVARELSAGRVPVLFSNSDARRDYVYVDDVCDMMLRCTEYRGTGLVHLFNVASGVGYTTIQLYATMAAAVGTGTIPVLREPGRFWSDYPTLLDMSQERVVQEVNKSSVGCAARAWRELGWVARTSIEVGISKMVESMR